MAVYNLSVLDPSWPPTHLSYLWWSRSGEPSGTAVGTWAVCKHPGTRILLRCLQNQDLTWKSCPLNGTQRPSHQWIIDYPKRNLVSFLWLHKIPSAPQLGTLPIRRPAWIWQAFLWKDADLGRNHGTLFKGASQAWWTSRSSKPNEVLIHLLRSLWAMQIKRHLYLWRVGSQNKGLHWKASETLAPSRPWLWGIRQGREVVIEHIFP